MSLSCLLFLHFCFSVFIFIFINHSCHLTLKWYPCSWVFHPPQPLYPMHTVLLPVTSLRVPLSLHYNGTELTEDSWLLGSLCAQRNNDNACITENSWLWKCVLTVAGTVYTLDTMPKILHKINVIKLFDQEILYSAKVVVKYLYFRCLKKT